MLHKYKYTPRRDLSQEEALEWRYLPAVGGEAAICPEDGYMLLDVTGDD